MTLRDDLRPAGRNRVIDLVRAAGIDVSDWGNFARGPEYAAVNPKYCYEWAFVDPAGLVVLNLWFRDILETRGTVRATPNMRTFADKLTQQRAKSLWIKRAQRMDDAFRFAATAKARVRIIINEGRQRDVEDGQAQASAVERRMLDPLPWYAQSYEPTTGACVLVRSLSDAPKVDQFDLESRESSSPDRVLTQSMVFVRDARVRAAVLDRAAGRCEYCGTAGFTTVVGQVFLETHHVIPLSEGGLDSPSNVAAVCPNHHREAHFGISAPVIRDFLLVAAAGRRRQRSA